MDITARILMTSIIIAAFAGAMLTISVQINVPDHIVGICGIAFTASIVTCGICAIIVIWTF